MIRYLNGGLKLDWKSIFYGPKCPIFEWSAKLSDFTIWIVDTQIVQYSYESGILESSIHMVTVLEREPWSDKRTYQFIFFMFH